MTPLDMFLVFATLPTMIFVLLAQLALYRLLRMLHRAPSAGSRFPMDQQESGSSALVGSIIPDAVGIRLTIPNKVVDAPPSEKAPFCLRELNR